MTVSPKGDIIITETKTTARQPTGQEVKHEKLSSTLRLQKHDHQHQQKRSETPQNLGGDSVLITNMHGIPICAARRAEDGKPYSYTINE